ncbi:MAG: PAS domain S-box protein [Bryobacteraceae bacterium]|nr:PAS domain S-box protein [Bryobacteraceae bacterium]
MQSTTKGEIHREQGDSESASTKTAAGMLPVSPFAAGLLAITAFISLGISISLLLFAHSGGLAESGWRAAMSAMCNGKAGGIAAWYKEREADLYEIRASFESLKDLLDGPAGGSRQERGRRVLKAMREVRRGFDCKALAILDRDGNVLLSEPRGGIPAPETLRPYAEEALRRRSVILQQGHLDPSGMLLLGFFLPFSQEPRRTNDVVLAMWADAGPLLRVMLQPPEGTIPGFENVLSFAQGGELHLVRSSGVGPGAVRLEVRNPPKTRRLVATGTGRIVRVRTPGGLEVGARVEGTPWTLKVRAEPAAVLGEVWFHSLYIGWMAAALLVLSGFGGYAAWRHRELRLSLRLAKAELERRKLQEHYESIVRQTHDILWWADTQGRILDCNDRALEVYGYSREELRGMRLPDLRPPEEREASEETVRRVRDAGQLVFTATHKKKNGETFPVEVCARLVVLEGEELIIGAVRDLSEKARVERSLKESEDRLRTALRHAAVILARQDADLRYTWCYGKHPPDCSGEVAGRSDEDLFGPGEAARLKEIKIGVLATGNGARTEVLRRGHSGDAWFDLIIEPERDASGRITGLINILLDITERKLAQELLDSSERKYRRLVEQIPGAVYARSLRQGFPWTYISPQAEKLLGFTPFEWTRTPGLPERQIHSEDLASVQRALQSCLEENQPVTLEYRIWHRDGRLLWFRDHLLLATREDGAPSHLQGLLVDITDMRRAEEQVQKLSSVIENSPLSVVITDAAGLVEYANAEFYRANGLSGAQVLGRPILELKPEYAYLIGGGGFPQQVLAGGVVQGEVPVQKNGRAARWERVTIAGTRGGGPGAPSLVVVSQDVTEIRQYLEEVRQLQKMEAVGRLAGGVAHDFNNLLTIVRGYSDLLLEEIPVSSPHRGSVDEIHQAASRASQLVRQLLTFSRRQVSNREVLDLNKVIRSATSMLARLLGEEIQIETALDPELRPVQADQGQLEQVLMNLAVNARDAMPEGGRLWIRTRNVRVPADFEGPVPPVLAPGGDYVQMVIEDSGSGIPPEVLPHIFEPFFTTKEVGKGTGLGLSVVYGIVQQSGGHIRAESPPGRGAVFTIWLPAAEPDGTSGTRPTDTVTAAVL